MGEHATARGGVAGDVRCSVVQVEAGTGFLLEDRLIVSCAHVITGHRRTDGTAPAGPVTVRFPHLDGQDLPAEIIPEWWHDPDRGDVAFLRLAGTLPEQAPAAAAGRTHAGRTAGASVRVPNQRSRRRRVRLRHHRRPGDQRRRTTMDTTTEATEITKGFSGAPAVDEHTGLVVGMINAVTPPDQFGRGTQTAYLIPAEWLRALYPALPTAGICPYRGLAPFTSEDTAWFFG
jgi:Trypsin-like peptidase domain